MERAMEGIKDMKRILIEETQIDPRTCCFVLPWKRDTDCYNFRKPKECVIASKIETIEPKDVESLVIDCSLDDYSYIAEMTNLRQLYIYKGEKIYELPFIKNLINLNYLYIAQTHVSSVKEIEKLLVLQKKQRMTLPGSRRAVFGLNCIYIHSFCDIDGSRLLKQGRFLSEIILNDISVRH